MATTANTRSAALALISPRLLAPVNAAVKLEVSTPVFHVNSAGVADPTSITVVARLTGIEGVVTFSCTGGTLSGISGNTATLTYANMSAATATISASIVYRGQTFNALPLAIAKVIDGVKGDTGGTGARGAGQFFATGSVWDAAVADAATPGVNIAGDVVTISNGTTFIEVRKWDGAAWGATAPIYNGGAIFPGTVTTNQINANGLIVRATDGTPIVGINVPLNPAYAATGTLNSDLPLGAPNLIVSNSLPASTSGFTAASSSTAYTWTGATYAGPGSASGYHVYSPGATGVVYVSAAGTPAAATFIELYLNTGARTPVVAGRRYQFAIALSAHRCDARLAVIWYDSAGASISTQNGSLVGVTALNSGANNTSYPSDFPRSTLLVTAPTGAVSVLLLARQVHTGLENPVLFTSQWYVAEAQATQVVVSAWVATPGELAVNASAGATAAAAIPGINSNVAAKLNKNAADILAGPIALQAGGSVIAGTLTVDANGNRTGGSGVGISSKGIAGYNAAGASTFAIEATTGNATFGGTLTASKVVTTDNLADNSSTDTSLLTSIPVVVASRAAMASPPASDSDYTTLHSYTFTPVVSGPVVVHYVCRVGYVTSGAGPFAFDTPYIKIDTGSFNSADNTPPVYDAGGSSKPSFTGTKRLTVTSGVSTTVYFRCSVGTSGSVTSTASDIQMIVEVIKK